MTSIQQITAGDAARPPNKVCPNVIAQVEGNVACVDADVSARIAGAVLARVKKNWVPIQLYLNSTDSPPRAGEELEEGAK